MVVLCRVCKWEFGNLDHFCPGCGSQLRVCKLGELQQLGDGHFQIEVFNTGQLSLSWVAESDDESIIISPDYGEIDAAERKVVSISLPADLRTWSLKFYTNDPFKPEVDVTGCVSRSS